MKRPLSQAAFDAYVANPECAAYLASDILEKRLHQLLRLITDGENGHPIYRRREGNIIHVTLSLGSAQEHEPKR